MNVFEAIIYFIMITLMFGFMYSLVDTHTFGIGCKTKDLFSEDKYCVNIENRSYYKEWKIFSHEQDRLNEIKRLERIEALRLKEEAFQKCYDEGYFVNESFLVSDYFNCNQIEYLNDHLMDNFEKKNAGYIRGSYSGFFSSGYIRGATYQYVNERILATGKLIENINYQLDCNEKHQDESIDYYSEEEFVMFYVKECIK